MGMSKEVVEFGSKGLTALKDEVKSLETAIADTQKANTKFSRQINDGTWERHSKRLATARKELVGIRVENERLQRLAQRQQLDSRYGRLAGGAMYFGQRFGGTLANAAQGAGSSLLGAVAGIGAPLAVGALAKRGFEGTAGAARLDMELTRLSRNVAHDLLPALNLLTDTIGRVNRARDATRAGRGTASDYAISYGARAAMLGAGFVGANFITRGALGRGVMSAGRLGGGYAMSGFNAARGGAQAFGSMGGFGSSSMGWAAPALGITAAGAYGASGTISQARSNKRVQGAMRGEWTPEQYDRISGFADRIRAISDPIQRQAALEKVMQRQAQAALEIRKRQEKRGGFGAFFGAEDRRLYESNATMAFAARGLLEEARGGKKFGRPGDDGSMLRVEGAGVRQASGDLYQELAEGFAQRGGISEQQQGESLYDKAANAVIDLRDSLLGPIEAFMRVFS